MDRDESKETLTPADAAAKALAADPNWKPMRASQAPGEGETLLIMGKLLKGEAQAEE